MINVLMPLVISVLIPVGLATLKSAADAGIHKEILGSGTSGSGTRTLKISQRNERHLENK